MKFNESLLKETETKAEGPTVAYGLELIKLGVPEDKVRAVIEQQCRLIGSPNSNLRKAWNELLAVFDAGFAAQIMQNQD